MKIRELEVGVSYIFKSNRNSGYPTVEKGLVVDKTKTSIKIKFETGFEKRFEIDYFESEYTILEKLD